jgi:predicted Zn-dependent peptidase
MITRITLLLGLVTAMLLSVPQHGNGQQTQVFGDDPLYKYELVLGDPTNTRIYTLPNGLKVYISVNLREPKVYTAIAVRTGSRNDPPNNTGLAHYLEHMLFKGTQNYGTINYEQEKGYLKQIYKLYEQFNQSRDSLERKVLYGKIDSVSQLAAQQAIPNEYDKLMTQLGAEGTNAFTSLDQTVYINQIPANQLEKFLQVEAERFTYPVFRLFHTELEAVYEEKNISLDNDWRKVTELMMRSLFPSHTYGTQTTLGEVEHLKNPSLVAIEAYYNAYYVPNNIAICLSGDLDPDATIRLINKLFGHLQAREVNPPTFPDQFTQPVKHTTHTVVGPQEPFVVIAYRSPGVNTREALVMELIDNLLSNGNVGLIDLNLLQSQAILEGYSFLWDNTDYSLLALRGAPKANQTLTELENLLEKQLDLIRSGAFDTTLVQAIVRNKRISRIRDMESNRSRALGMAYAYTQGQKWKDIVVQLDEMETISAAEIQQVANQYLIPANRVVIYKENGPKTESTKIPKPQITPLPTNADQTSKFVENLSKQIPPPLKPVFVDFDTDITQVALDGNRPLRAVKNAENELFTLYYTLKTGSHNNPTLAFATEYLDYLGTSKYSPEELKVAFFKLGCSFGITTGPHETSVYVSGLDETFEEAVQLLEHLLTDAQPNADALIELVARVTQERENEKLDKNTILYSALRDYATFGPSNPTRSRLNADQLSQLDAKQLTQLIGQIPAMPHVVQYYGPRKAKDVAQVVNKLHPAPQKALPLSREREEFGRLALDKPQVLFVHYDMVQAHLLWLGRGPTGYDSTTNTLLSLYNEYFGGGMSSIVFQQIREARALAYSTWSRYSSPTRKQDPYYNMAFVGTQADKMPDALEAMSELLRNPPKLPNKLADARESLRNTLASDRVLGTRILSAYERAKDLGLSTDQRKLLYQNINNLNIEDISAFHQKYLAKLPYTLLVLGNRDLVDMEVLKKYGPVRELSLEEIFGF